MNPMTHLKTSRTARVVHQPTRLLTAALACVIISLSAAIAFADEAPVTPPAATQPATTQSAATQPAVLPAVAEPATPEFLKGIQDDLRQVTSVQSKFTQTKQLAIFDHKVIIRGRFALAKPERLIWLVKSPVKYAVRLVGAELRQWDEDTNKVQTMQLSGEAGFQTASDQLKAWFLGDYSLLTETFNITIHSREPLTLIFTPKPEGMAKEFLNRVELTFGQNRLYIQKLVAHEPGGDVTTIEFTDTRINEPVIASVWDMPPHE